MAKRWTANRKRIAIGAAGMLGVLALGAILFAASGIYNVAASRGHFRITELALEFGMRRSVATHSIGISPPPLDDPDLIRLGAGHYHSGCALCHGAPGEPRTPVVNRMLPPPPDLGVEAPTWSAAEVYWIVKNGLKYTGMPAWAAQERGDEVWALVAFLRQLPKLEPAAYRALALGSADPPRGVTRETADFQDKAEAIRGCMRCHVEDSGAPASRLVPKLAGQHAPYLEQALRQYATGVRSSGIMQPVAAALDKDAIPELARYFAGLRPARAAADRAAPTGASADAVERGRTIATRGVPASGLPACLACHAGASRPTFPILAGQPAPYLTGQLRLWRRGVRGGTAHGAIMAPIARLLTDGQAADAAAFFESLPPAARSPHTGATSGIAQ